MKKIKFNKVNYVRNYKELIEWFDGMERYFPTPIIACAKLLKDCLELKPKQFCSQEMKTKIIAKTAILEKAQSKFFHPEWPVYDFMLESIFE